MQQLYEVYLIYSASSDAYKVGISKSTEKRIKQLQTASSCILEIRGIYQTERPFKVEGVLHKVYSEYKWENDIDKLSGEWFKLPVSEVINFKSKCSEIESRFELLVKSGNPFVS